MVRRLLARSRGRRLRRLRPAEEPRRARSGLQRRAADLQRLHGGGAQGPAGHAVPDPARRPPGARRSADRPVARRRTRAAILEAFMPGTEPTQTSSGAAPIAASGQAAGAPGCTSATRRRPAACTDAGIAAAWLPTPARPCYRRRPTASIEWSRHARRDQPIGGRNRAVAGAAEEASLTGTARSSGSTELNAKAEDPDLWNDAGARPEADARAHAARPTRSSGHRRSSRSRRRRRR